MKITKFTFPNLEQVILGQYESYDDGEITIKMPVSDRGFKTDEVTFNENDDPHFYMMEASEPEILVWMDSISSSEEYTESIN